MVLFLLKLSSDSIRCSDVSLAKSISLCAFVFVRSVLLDSTSWIWVWEPVSQQLTDGWEQTDGWFCDLDARTEGIGRVYSVAQTCGIALRCIRKSIVDRILSTSSTTYTAIATTTSRAASRRPITAGRSSLRPKIRFYPLRNEQVIMILNEWRDELVLVSEF